MKNIQRTILGVALITSCLISPIQAFAAPSVTVTDKKMAAPASPTPVVVETVTTTVKTEYELPYPGILPNNPLYFLKQFRDWLLEKLIVDPIKKAEFYLLQADKRLSMSILLATNNAEALSNQAISQTEMFMSKSVGMLTDLKDQGKEVPAYLIDRLSKSMSKHAEILSAELSRATSEARKTVIQSALGTLASLQEALLKLK